MTGTKWAFEDVWLVKGLAFTPRQWGVHRWPGRPGFTLSNSMNSFVVLVVWSGKKLVILKYARHNNFGFIFLTFIISLFANDFTIVYIQSSMHFTVSHSKPLAVPGRINIRNSQDIGLNKNTTATKMVKRTSPLIVSLWNDYPAHLWNEINQGG